MGKTDSRTFRVSVDVLAVTVLLVGCSDDPTVVGTTSFDTLVLATTSLPLAFVGRAYDQTLAAQGGNGSNSWSVTSGALPTGILLGADGWLSGTPAALETQSFTVQVTSGDGQVAAQSLSLIVRVQASLPSKIGFTSNRLGTYLLFTADIDGRNPTRFPSSPFDPTDAAWTEDEATSSPDGSRVAFSGFVRGGSTEIFAMDADGSNLTRLTDYYESDSHPAWSPDGTRLAFASRRGPFGGSRPTSQLWVVDADGSTVAGIQPPAPLSAFSPVWSPDGGVIAFVGGNIYGVGPDGTGSYQLTDRQLGTVTDPAWSPDGAKLLYVWSGTIGDANRRSQIYVMDRDGSNHFNLSNSTEPAGQPAWSPDGSKILFTSFVNGSSEIFIMDADGSNQAQLTDDPADDRNPFWPSN